MILAGSEHAGKLTSEETHTMKKTGWKAYMDYAKFCGGYFVMAMLLLLLLLFTLSRLSSGVWLQIWLDQGDGLEVSSEAYAAVIYPLERLPTP
jgi:hypothetical protein